MCSVRKVNDLLGEKIKMESVEVKELSFAYENTDTLILKNLNMQIQEGDFVCLLGQSGCGKSTLLRLLAGLEKPTNGEILIDGKPIKGASLERSVVFQDYGLFPWMTAGENIVLALKQKFPKQKKSELKAIAKEMLVKVGLDESVYGKLPKELSGGMKQRCAIARSFSINPPVLLMDEPFGALDAVTRARLQEMVLDLWKSDETKVVLPAAMPSIISGFVTSLRSSFLVLVFAEMYGAEYGMGYFIKKYSVFGLYPNVWSGFIFMVVILVIIVQIFEKLQNKLLKWTMD